MEMKKEVKQFLEEKGIRKGKIEIFNIIREIENEAEKVRLGGKEKQVLDTVLEQIGIPTTESLTNKAKEIMGTSSRKEEVYRTSDPVVPKAVGLYDSYLTENKEYRIIKVEENLIWIHDDSGDLNPYIKNRFKNTSPYLNSEKEKVRAEH